jgi:hypothetical protein
MRGFLNCRLQLPVKEGTLGVGVIPSGPGEGTGAGESDNWPILKINPISRNSYAPHFYKGALLAHVLNRQTRKILKT